MVVFALLTLEVPFAGLSIECVTSPLLEWPFSAPKESEVSLCSLSSLHSDVKKAIIQGQPPTFRAAEEDSNQKERDKKSKAQLARRGKLQDLVRNTTALEPTKRPSLDKIMLYLSLCESI